METIRSEEQLTAYYRTMGITQRTFEGKKISAWETKDVNYRIERSDVGQVRIIRLSDREEIWSGCWEDSIYKLNDLGYK